MNMFPAVIIFLKAIILGVGVSAPPGPNAMLMINRTLRKGHFSGFMTGMGVATADTIFAIIAGLGLSFIIGFVNQQSFYIKLFAGLLVAAIGIKLFLSNPVPDIRGKMKESMKKSPLQDYLSVFMLALANPFSIFIYVALFSGMDISFSGSGMVIPLVIITGIFTGASLWWLGFSWIVNHFSRSMRLRSVVTLTRISGVVIITIGVAVLLTIFRSNLVIG
jgi:threonine/homoserine/homoserine lactone efflux protein